MGQLLVVSKIEEIREHQKIAEEFHVSYEINDFFDPMVLDHEDRINRMIEKYQRYSLPKDCTMHGAFFDIVLFSQDPKIQEVSQLRMIQSMEIAKRLGVKGVVFHTNINPILVSKTYNEQAISMTVAFWKQLLHKYPAIDLYLENMFDADPFILSAIAKQLCEYENFGVCLDYAHARISRTDPEIWLKELGRYIKHFHINDNDLIHDLHYPVGSGKIEWDAFFKAYVQDFKECSLLIETTKAFDQRTSLTYIKEHYPEVLALNS